MHFGMLTIAMSHELDNDNNSYNSNNDKWFPLNFTYKNINSYT